MAADIEALIEECQEPIRRALRETTEYSKLTEEEFLQVACIALELVKSEYHMRVVELEPLANPFAPLEFQSGPIILTGDGEE